MEAYGDIYWSPSNTDSDPCFAEPGYWDPNGTGVYIDDDIWVDGDYHLQWDSPCINAGDPNFAAEPNETDIDGEPRVMEGLVDMGSDEIGPKQADFTRDGVINSMDFAILGKSWLSLPGDGNWGVLRDLDRSGATDMIDVALLADDWLWQALWYGP